MSRTRSIKFPNQLTELEALLDKLQRVLTNRLLVTGALAIKTGGSALAKTANTIYFMIDGQVYSKAAADMAALSGTVTNAKFNVFAFTVNSAGTLKSYMGTEASTLGGVTFPTVPDGEVSVGFVIINPTGTGNFVGGTTALDDGTVVPNAAYVNTADVYNSALQTL